MKYESNANTVIFQLKQKLLSSESQDKLAKTIAQAIYASNLRRIHNEGLNTRKKRIGKYSSEPTYINPKNSPVKFTAVGKGGKETKTKSSKLVFNIKSKKAVTQTTKSAQQFKSGKAHKTRYFDGGYKEFRWKIGREYHYVNLDLSGSLRANYQLLKDGNSYIIGFMSSKKAEIATGLEKHFHGKIWGMTKEDWQLAETIKNNWSNK